MNDLQSVLPDYVSRVLPSIDREKLTEIRLRIGRPVYFYIGGIEYGMDAYGITRRDGRVFSLEDARAMWARLCDGAPYGITEEQKRGYRTVEGNRIGFSGTYAGLDGKAKYLECVTSFCVRIMHQIKGCAAPIFPYLTGGRHIYHTLIVSPPGCGKTTCLRDLTRTLSGQGYNVAVADERDEIAAMQNGVPTLDVGKRTDVISGMKKTEAVPNLIRTLHPDVIVVDELGGGEDVTCIRQAQTRGVAVVASAHGATVEDVRSRLQVPFERYVLLGSSRGVGTLEAVTDANGMRLPGRQCC